MKFDVLLENLQKKLTFVNRAVSVKNQLPALLNILLETKKGQLIISSTDLEIGIQTSTPVNVEEDGKKTVPARSFIELINTLPPGKITIQTEKQNLIVLTPKTKSVFQTTPEEEFPKLYEEKGSEAIRLKKETIQKDLLKVVFAASTDTTRAELSGVYVNIRESSAVAELILVATDGYRLSLKSSKSFIKTTGKKEPTVKPLLIPNRVLKEVVAMKDEDEDVGIFLSDKNNQVLFEQGSTILVGRLIEAQFPSYERIIPTDFATRTFFDKDDLQKAVKTCVIFARESSNTVHLSINKNAITVSAKTPSLGENTVEVDAKTQGDDGEIAFNARYLLELLGNIEEEEMVFEMTTPLKPGVFKIKDDPSFLHLIMPIRTQAES